MSKFRFLIGVALLSIVGCAQQMQTVGREYSPADRVFPMLRVDRPMQSIFGEDEKLLVGWSSAYPSPSSECQVRIRKEGVLVRRTLRYGEWQWSEDRKSKTITASEPNGDVVEIHSRGKEGGDRWLKSEILLDGDLVARVENSETSGMKLTLLQDGEQKSWSLE